MIIAGRPLSLTASRSGAKSRRTVTVLTAASPAETPLLLSSGRRDGRRGERDSVDN